MVAYSFKRQFVPPIRVGLGLRAAAAIKLYDGTNGLVDLWAPRSPEVAPPPPYPTAKLQTIRAVGKRRHVRPGEEVQLYTGMRSKGCFLIGRGRCKDVRDILITLKQIGGCVSVGSSQQRLAVYQGEGLGEFARSDGFDGWASMLRFWKDEHGDTETFIGVLIE